MFSVKNCNKKENAIWPGLLYPMCFPLWYHLYSNLILVHGIQSTLDKEKY